MNSEMQIETWSIDKVRPYTRNPRKIPQRAIDKVAASIQEFGWRQPIVVDAAGIIIVGHVRWLAARKLGLNEVPVHVAGLTHEQAREYRLNDNRSHEETAWDRELLPLEMLELKALHLDLKFTGFEPREIDELLANPDPAAGDAASSPVPTEPVSRPNDLWRCGAHRVLQGDATNPAHVARALGDLRPLLMTVDPPWGVSFGSDVAGGSWPWNNRPNRQNRQR
jgi:hypothetical protein